MKRRRIWIPLGLFVATISLAVFLPSLIFKRGPVREPYLVQAALTVQSQLAVQTEATVQAGFTPSDTPAVFTLGKDLASTITPIVPGAPNCTYDLTYWKDHPEAWPEEIIIGGNSYSRDNAHQLFQSNPEDPSVHLTQQVYVAFLNILFGADPELIGQTVIEASAWLRDNPPGSVLSQFNRDIVAIYVDRLDAYNLGQLGPDACPNQISLPTATVITDTPTPSLTPVIIQPTSTRPPFRPPPATDSPTREPRDTPTSPPPANTQPPPPPRDTQPPPTSAPPATSVPPTEALPTPAPLPTEALPPPPQEPTPTLAPAPLLGWLGELIRISIYKTPAP
ncbi:MAG: hypothetical protein EHM70_00410 [Chloroflexota bacterium]|nr:MAG: hypothetical protein EHM70_00410 [Chloroflexota bacterium]